MSGVSAYFHKCVLEQCCTFELRALHTDVYIRMFVYMYTWCVCICIILNVQIPQGVSDDEAVRIFIEFSKVDTAIKG